jgi:cytochrome c peroxidase
MVSPYDGMTDADKNYIDKIQQNVGRAFEAYPRRLVTHNSPFERYVKGDYTAIDDAAKRGLKLFIGKAACDDCHHGPLLSDEQFHNIGVPTPMFEMDDPGRAAILFLVFLPDFGPGSFNRFNGAGPYSDDPVEGARRLAKQDQDACLPHDPTMPCMPKPEVIGTFRTPTLLNVAETAPYFHTGEAATLEDVVRHYNKGGAAPGSYPGIKSPRLKPLGLTDAEISDIVSFLGTLTGEFDDPSFAGPPANPKPRLPGI